MRIATFILICLLAVISPALAGAEPAGATTGGQPTSEENDGDETGMTCCHHG